jgi:cellulase/cellobiase CelA1
LVKYVITDQWQNGFNADVTITNQSGTALNGWQLAWSFAGNQRITNTWNGITSQSGKKVRVSNASWNGAVPNSGSTAFGFQATYSGKNAIPTSFTLNGMQCSRQ